MRSALGSATTARRSLFILREASAPHPHHQRVRELAFKDSDFINPLVVFLDEIHKSINRFRFGDVELHRGFSDIEIHLARRSPNIAEVSIGHLTRAVDDASHDSDANSLEMSRGGLDAGRGGLKVKESSSAGGAGDIVGLEDAHPRRLENIVGQAK